MKKQTKIALIVSVALAIAAAVAAWLLYKYRHELANPKTPDSGEEPLLKDVWFPIGVGASGAKVVALQKALNAQSPAPYEPLDVDGKFGEKTLARLQALYGISRVENPDDYSAILDGTYKKA